MEKPRILLVTFPGQGHLNPGLQFSRRLIRAGVDVTYATTAAAHRRINDGIVPKGLKFAFYSDGYEDGSFNINKTDVNHYMSELYRCGSLTLEELIRDAEMAGRPFTWIVYSVLVPWAARVARKHHVPSTFLWIQPAIVFDIYYYFFNGYGDVLRSSNNSPCDLMKLPGLPLLGPGDLPSFLSPSGSGAHDFALPLFEEHMQILREEGSSKVLMNTYEELEREALKADEGLELVAVGPLVPSIFFEVKQPSAESKSLAESADINRDPKNYLKWLDSKPESSVIYVSFGSYSAPPKQQMEEVARALLETGRPFLWVVRALEFIKEGKKVEEEVFGCKEELEKLGMIVEWCSQAEVLSHPAVGCYVMHCGWNSTLESLASGLPVVAFPLWTDQTTNAKMIEDVWRTGVRVREGPKGDGVVEREEVKKCLDLVADGGERAEEMRRNARKWKELAKEAAKEGGTADKNVEAFVDWVGRLSNKKAFVDEVNL